MHSCIQINNQLLRPLQSLVASSKLGRPSTLADVEESPKWRWMNKRWLITTRTFHKRIPPSSAIRGKFFDFFQNLRKSTKKKYFEVTHRYHGKAHAKFGWNPSSSLDATSEQTNPADRQTGLFYKYRLNENIVLQDLWTDSPCAANDYRLSWQMRGGGPSLANWSSMLYSIKRSLVSNKIIQHTAIIGILYCIWPPEKYIICRFFEKGIFLFSSYEPIELVLHAFVTEGIKFFLRAYIVVCLFCA